MPEMRGVKCFWEISLFTFVPFDLEQANSAGIWRRSVGIFLGDVPRLPPQGGGAPVKDGATILKVGAYFDPMHNLKFNTRSDTRKGITYYFSMM